MAVDSSVSGMMMDMEKTACWLTGLNVGLLALVLDELIKLLLVLGREVLEALGSFGTDVELIHDALGRLISEAMDGWMKQYGWS